MLTKARCNRDCQGVDWSVDSQGAAHRRHRARPHQAIAGAGDDLQRRADSGRVGVDQPAGPAADGRGRLKPATKGKYDRGGTTRDYVVYLREQNTVANQSTSESRVREARAAEIEVRTAERTRRLITLEEALEPTLSSAATCAPNSAASPRRSRATWDSVETSKKLWMPSSLASLIGSTRKPRLLQQAALLLKPSPMMTPDQWANSNRTYPASSAIPWPRDPWLEYNRQVPAIRELNDSQLDCVSGGATLIDAFNKGIAEGLLEGFLVGMPGKTEKITNVKSWPQQG
jgi:hypothetical protein